MTVRILWWMMAICCGYAFVPVATATALTDPSGFVQAYSAPSNLKSEFPSFFGNKLVYSDYNNLSLTRRLYFVNQDTAGIFSLESSTQTADYANSPTGSWEFRGAVVSDLDYDSYDDLVLCGTVVDENDNYVPTGSLVLSSGPSVELGASQCTGRNTVADVDHDGQPDIVMANGYEVQVSSLQASLKSTVSSYQLHNDLSEGFANRPVIGRFGDDALTRIFMVSNRQVDGHTITYAHVIDGNGQVLSSLQLPAQDRTNVQPVAADIDSDGRDEVILGGSSVDIFNSQGQILRSIAVACYDSVVANVDADSDLEVLCSHFAGSTTTIDAYNLSDGTHVALYPMTLPAETHITGGVIVVRLAGAHTVNDVIIATSQGILAYRGSDLQQLWSLPLGMCRDVAAYDFGQGMSLIALCGADDSSLQNRIYRLTDDTQPLSSDIQEDVALMSGYSPQMTFNIAGAALSHADGGYRFVASDGGVFPFGLKGGYGSTGNINLWKPIVGMAETSTDGGYWLVASDGGIFPFGDAVGYGSTGNVRLWQPIVGMTKTATDQGYWLVASDGGIFPFGDAVGYGSTGGIRLNKPIVGMAVTPSGHGYWLVASDGGIFPFGDAVGYGSTGNINLRKPIVGMAATPSGNGYWLVASDGGIFPFGDAVGYGSAGNINLWKPIVGMKATSTGHGYWLVAADGGVFTYGDAKYYGSTGDIALWKPIVGIGQ